jgi:hypothetical protein
MQSEPIAISAAPPPGSVSGLGVSDALRLELQPVQVPWLISELEEMRGPLEEQLQRTDTDEHEELAARRYELRLLRLMRAQLPAAGHGAPIAFVGPSGMVRQLVHAALANAVAALAELVGQGPRRTAQAPTRLRDTAAAVLAWAETLADCHAVESFSLDPDADPSGAW